MSSNMENRSRIKQIERLRWVILIVFWCLVTVPFMLLMQKRHVTFLIVGLFLLVCVSIVIFWLTCRGRDAGDENMTCGEKGPQT